MLDKKKYIAFLEKPELISQEENLGLKNIIQQYPYFQSTRVLQLKALKHQENYKYNNELKLTAAHTSDRALLFDFITSDAFKVTPTEKKEKKTLKEIILPKKKIEETTFIKEALTIGKPLSFTDNETFSFNQWLQLSSKKEIVRVNSEVSNKQELSIKSKKDAIIDRFIETTPKISRPSKTNANDTKIIENQQDNQLATETLAKVYLEQKKYDSAIQAYKILSLKYPEKSGFFADQIKRIQILQKNK